MRKRKERRKLDVMPLLASARDERDQKEVDDK
jgi:hypothetical protein